MVQRNIEDFIITAEAILSRVDEYTLYCHYLEFEPELGVKYKSRVRPGDDNPSFSMFKSKISGIEYRWKDHGSTLKGDIFDLISILHGNEPRYQTYLRVNADFSLGFTGEGPPPTQKIIYNEPPSPREPLVIKIKSRPFTDADLNYWLQYGITKGILDMYKVKAVDAYYLNEYIKSPIDPCYSYQIKKGFKLYRPFAPKEQKFRNNFSPETVEGLEQVTGNGDVLIITKAMKDVMMFRTFGIDAIAGKSENTPIPADVIIQAKRHYKEVVVWLDNDEPGLKAAQYYKENYKLRTVIVPDLSIKDPSDYRSLKGYDETSKLIQSLIYYKDGE